MTLVTGRKVTKSKCVKIVSKITFFTCLFNNIKVSGAKFGKICEICGINGYFEGKSGEKPKKNAPAAPKISPAEGSTALQVVFSF